MLLLCTASVSGQEVFDRGRGIFSTGELTASASVGLERRIEIRSVETMHGTIKISVDSTPVARAMFFKRAKTRNRSLAIDYIDLISVHVQSDPRGAIIWLRAPNPAPWSGTNNSGFVDMELTLPSGCDVFVEAPLFDIDAIGPFETFIVSSSLGRLEVANVTEELDLETSNRRVALHNIRGEVSVTTSNASLRASDIIADNGPAEFRNDGGDIRIDGLVGEVNVKCTYGRIDLRGIEPKGRRNLIRGSSAPIYMEITELGDARVKLTNKLEDIELIVPEDLSAFLNLAVDETGRIEATQLTFQPDLIEYNRLNLVCGKGDGIISSTTRGGGNIFVRGYEPGE
ncbi:MAG: hypothetical protein ACE5FH_04905 [Candidatus Zixiibacteriota bacterium]